MNMQKKGVLLMIAIGLILMLHTAIRAQEVKKFSLKEAQQYALDNNYQIKNAKTDIEIAKQKVKENTAIGLPQINASASYSYFMDIPTTLIPDFLSPAIISVNENIFGLEPTVEVSGETQYFEAKFGVPHNATWGGSISQLIFSGQYLIGLKAAKAYATITESTYEKSEIEIKDAVAKAYYPVIIIKENKNYLDSTLISMKKMLYETQEYYNNGFIEDTDVDQLKLMISDMETTLAYIDNQLNLATNMLKFMLGLKAEEQIEATESLGGLLTSVNSEFLVNSKFDFNNNIDYSLLKKSEKLTDLQVRLRKSEYLPTMSAFYQYQQNGLRDQFDFFDFSKNWYPSQMIGVQLDIPIWSSGMRKYKVNQAKMELDKVKVRDTELQQRLNLTVETYRSEFNNAYLIYNNRIKSLDIAKKIYQKNEIKYKEGISTSLDLSQSYNQYLKAEIDYLTSILDLLMKKSDLDKLLTKAAN
jgi:outer membrane protein TolC